MGQKAHPKSLRIGIHERWTSRWLFPPVKGDAAGGKRLAFAKYLEEDEAVRNVIEKKIGQAGIAEVDIERTINNVTVRIKAARPGLIIGRGGKGIEELTKALEGAIAELRGGTERGGKVRISVNVEELKRTEMSARYVAQQIAWDLERRFPYRRAMKKHLDQVMQNKEVKGAKLTISGRLNGAEIARSKTVKSGPLPLQNLRAVIDYGQVTARTTYGTIGVKVWIYKGEKFADEGKTQ